MKGNNYVHMAFLTFTLHHCMFEYSVQYQRKFYISRPQLKVEFMVFNAIFNNVSVISWQSVLLVEETGENH